LNASAVNQYLPTIIILTAAALAILLILYRIWDSRVEAPKKLEDEVAEALNGAKADVASIEPARKAAAALSYLGNRCVIVREFGKLPTRLYSMAELIGIEVFVNNKVAARIIRGGAHKMFDDIAPQVDRVTIRLMFNDPSKPDFELILWDPNDALTARAEGPRAAMETARRWFYHVEAIIRKPLAEIEKELTPPAPPPPPPEPTPKPPVHDHRTDDTDNDDAPPPAPKPAPKDGDVLNSPLIQYL
jgi:cell division septation protein DedD